MEERVELEIIEKQEVLQPEVNETAPPAHRGNPYLIPLAIFAGAVVIAGTIAYVGMRYIEAVSSSEKKPAGDLSLVRPVGPDDHIVGNPNAPIVIIEYSDFECPFCKEFHATMRKIAAKYAAEGTVAWVYRHFPLEALHAKAKTEAIASECVAELGGNEAFWKFTDRLFEITPSNDQLDHAILPRLAEEAGVGKAPFEECLSSARHAKRVEADYANAVATGGNGTPWSIIILADGTKGVINGAQPYETIQSGIDGILAGNAAGGK